MATCPKCGCDAAMTEHHIYPQRFFGKDRDGNNEKVVLCQRCHGKLENQIPFSPEQPKEFYEGLARDFLGNSFDDAFKKSF
ncbi:MAG: hypothetical protein KBC12_00925 [Candidatus Pacebacteria bacterium]|nr:hypothetical protein [Candidatus Paceibacterota bacterium]MBP9851494.1 hypothetical protein [Candidatus Paceibacterota bacterium]